MDNYLRAINHALDCSTHRLKWYIETKDQRFMDECKEWMVVADVYMNEIIKEQKHETCESEY